jgi:transposase
VTSLRWHGAASALEAIWSCSKIGSTPHLSPPVDSFHAIQLANRCVDTLRRRVQNEQKGHRGRKHDPLYQVRRTLLTGEKKLDDDARERLMSSLELGDPHGEVVISYMIKERLRDFHQQTSFDVARAMLEEISTTA